MKNLVQTALAAALTEPDDGATLGASHRNRSKDFVESLAAELRQRYAQRDDVVVFSKHYEGNRKRHGLNELMFDVAVCETGQVSSATGRTFVALVPHPDQWQSDGRPTSASGNGAQATGTGQMASSAS